MQNFAPSQALENGDIRYNPTKTNIIIQTDFDIQIA